MMLGRERAFHSGSCSARLAGRLQAGARHVHPRPAKRVKAGSSPGPSPSPPSSWDEEEDMPPPVAICDTMNKYQERCASCEPPMATAWDAPDLPRHHTSRRGITNKVQLSTYADCIGNDLADLVTFLQTEVRDAVGSVHLLPIYPSTGDRGFAPINYFQVDPKFGDWTDVRMLAAQYQLCLEYMVNHISPESEAYQDYLRHGEKSKYASMFVKWYDIFPNGPSAEELAKIRTRKPEPPLLVAEMADGTRVPLWCTFSPQQIDINPNTPEGWAFTESSLKSLILQGGCSLIRLDAFGYVTKKAGTSCFMLEPEVWQLLARIRDLVRPFGVQLLCEVHEDFNLNIELARHGFWVYDFALPLLVIHAFKFQTAESLRYWLSICPRRQITTLDTHDGMGVDDITGLAPIVDLPELQQSILDIGGNINYKHFYRTTKMQGNGNGNGSVHPALQRVADYLQPDCLEGTYVSEPHQLNATYFSALGEDPKRHLCARAIQFFTPGVPMVYYNGLLAGVNDYELCAKGSIRDINRHFYSLEEAREKAQQPHVQALLRLCRFRNAHPAFKGRIYVDDKCPSHMLHVRWYYGAQHVVELKANMRTSDFTIRHTPYDPAAAFEMASPYSVDMATIFSIDAMDIDSRRHARADAERAQMFSSRVTDTAQEEASPSGTSEDEVAAPGDLEWHTLDLSDGWGVVKERVARVV